jgi:hypothetical protein
MPGAFEKNIKACKALAPHFKPGLQALKNADKQHLHVQHPRRLTGSVDVDAALETDLASEPRWDYAIGYGGSEDETVHWVEVHPATDGQVRAVLAKLDWLRSWLKRHAAPLGAMKCRYIWVSSGTTAISPNAPARRMLAQKGLLLVGATHTIG